MQKSEREELEMCATEMGFRILYSKVGVRRMTCPEVPYERKTNWNAVLLVVELVLIVIVLALMYNAVMPMRNVCEQRLGYSYSQAIGDFDKELDFRNCLKESVK